MTRGFKRLLAGLALAALVLLVAIRLSVWLVEYQPHCSQPCRDPGEIPAPPAEMKYPYDLAPTCDMASLAVEVRPNHPIKVNEPVQLFFRIAMENRSCLVFRLDPDHWISLYKPPWSLEVLGVDGRLLEAAPWPRMSKEIERLAVVEGDDRLKLFNERNGLHANEHVFELSPGGRVSPLGQKLSPAKRVMASWHDAEGTYDGYGWQHVSLPKEISAPPEGFQMWGNWVFTRPGKARVRARLDLLRLYAIFPRPYAHLVPGVWLRLLEEFGIRTAEPDRSYNVHAVSDYVELEVKP